MNEFVEHLAPYIKLLGGISLITFLVSFFIIPWFIGKLPDDYFLRLSQSNLSKVEKKSLYGVFLLVIKNLFGFFFLASGFIMLFIPGQGILTMVMGILLINVPGKKSFLMKIISQESIRDSLNWLRKKSNKPLFLWQAPKHESSSKS